MHESHCVACHSNGIPHLHASALTWKRMDSKMVIEFSDGVSETVKHAEFIAARHHVDVANLLGLGRFAAFLRHDPQPVSKIQPRT
jgi:hypothetical protein